ncbi:MULTISPECIES: tRNA lysidine(34) synthetase TilS [unclassified Lactobacillus]|uniref:tRNA lysidine(34) synthetase TilS n=1 Tax=unclassified Lactobacillus TaxID=2620435 RepID=UPI0018DE9CB3|nr:MULTISPECIES: tRNA lysidine(34) synthetase TilS [unclassified Lactobacillus]MBH9989729.1 tRNA lysidine(34) synthetase TilS [Lactobacillus sp. M0392]MBI0024226.1 tRNA lysidine(34) synthetase TilS [Lactobacillus sp. W8171]MBI0044770.1 tRNA lysidine(34) synthetase TilS [Lactobacillus sp. M0393]
MRIDDFFKINHLPLAAKTLVVAVSGGPDSLALLDLLYQIKEQYRFRLLAAHLDHQLRLDSFKEEKVISAYCQNKSIELINEKWPKCLQPIVGVEAAARKYRYDFLVKIMRNYQGDYLLTAHHMDDLLENILLKFIRSGNPSEMNSLKAISKMQGMTLLRPLLNIQKADLLKYDKRNHIPYVIDQTNNEDDTLRNKLRHHVIPLLKKENKQIGQNALRFSKEVSLLTSIVDERFAQFDQPKKFLNVAYRLKTSALKQLNSEQKQAFWQHFIWQTWQERVNQNLANYTLLVYQGFFYLFKQLPARPANKEIILDQVFSFNKRKFLLSLKADKPYKLLGSFGATNKKQLTTGSILPGTKLLLKDGSHVKSKKKFAQSGIPNILRPYCLTIYDGDKVVFIEQTYSNQQVCSGEKCFYLYEDN